MKIVYIAGPYRGPTAWDIECNIRRAEEAGLRVASFGAMPLIPHANTRFFHGLFDDSFWLDGTLELMRRCDAVYLLSGWSSSAGARGERDEAIRLGKPVFERLHAIGEWIRDNR